MPQLPSGRHLAIDPAPLVQQTEDRNKPQFVHHFMAVKDVASLAHWLDLHYFMSEEEARDNVKAVDLTYGSLVAPAGLVSMGTGYWLADWRTLAVSWTDDDRAAMADWLGSDRVKEQFNYWLKLAERLQQKMLSENAVPLIRTLATMYEQGVHPQQHVRLASGSSSSSLVGGHA